MNNMYITELNDIQIMRAENSVIALESCKMLGEFLGNIRAFVENEDSVTPSSNGGILSKTISFIKKIIKFIVKVITNIISFIFKILKAPFKLISKLLAKTEDESDSSDEVSSAVDSMTEALTTVGNNAHEDTSLTTWGTLTQDEQTKMLSIIEEHASDISLLDNKNNILCAKNNNITTESMNKLIESLNKLVTFTNGDNDKAIGSIITEFASVAGRKLSMSKLTATLPNPNSITNKVMTNAYEHISSLVFSIDVISNLAMCDVLAFESLTDMSDRNSSYKDVSVTPVKAKTDKIQNMNVMLNIDNNTLMHAYPKMIISSNNELYEYIYGDDKLSSIEALDPTKLKLNPKIAHPQVTNQSKLSKTWVYYVSQEHISDIKNTKKYDELSNALSNDVSRLKENISVLNDYSRKFENIDFTKIPSYYYRRYIDADPEHAPEMHNTLLNIPKILSSHIMQLNKLSAILDRRALFYAYGTKMGKHVPEAILKLTMVCAVRDYIRTVFTDASEDVQESTADNFNGVIQKVNKYAQQTSHKIIENN